MEHITRATLESLAYQTRDILDVMSQESSIDLKTLKVDGGASLNNFLMQFQSDIINIDIIRQDISEITALGAAFISGLSSGFFRDTEELKTLKKSYDTFRPQIDIDSRNRLYHGWKVAIESARKFKK